MKYVGIAMASAVAAQNATLRRGGPRANSGGPTDRIFASNQAISGADLFGFPEGYGCWCYFGADHLLRQAKGAPLDEWDRACQFLSWGYECAILDAEERGEECLPWVIDYETINTGESTDIYGDCRAKQLETNKFNLPIKGNGDPCEIGETVNGVDCAVDEVAQRCAIDACAVEARYLKHGNEMHKVVPVVQEFRHNNADFDHDENCYGVNHRADTIDIKCCGEYPIRQPWNSVNEKKKCCATRDPADGRRVEEMYNVRSDCCVIPADANTIVWDTTTLVFQFGDDECL